MADPGNINFNVVKYIEINRILQARNTNTDNQAVLNRTSQSRQASTSPLTFRDALQFALEQDLNSVNRRDLGAG